MARAATPPDLTIPEQGWPASVPVLIPVYNHAATVAAVVRGCQHLGATAIVVVDDGSSDDSAAEAEAAGALVIRCPENGGKGAALRLGLKHYAAVGARQVLTLDADMQHPPAEARRLAWAAAAHPEALWLGWRDMRQAPSASRAGCWWTSLWTWVACGVWPEDNQTGLRVYPLPAMVQIRVRAGRYAFEIESLIRAVWGRVTVHALPVAVIYPEDRVTHFDLLRDNLRMAWTFTRLVTRRCLPWPQPPLDGSSRWRQYFREGLTPRGVGGACALGAIMGVAPIPGLQMAAAAWLAVVLRLNMAVVLLASNISFGPLLVGWYGLQVLVGRALRSGEWTDVSVLIAQIREIIDTDGIWAAMLPLLADWLWGAIPVMMVAGIIAGFAGWALALGLRRAI